MRLLFLVLIFTLNPAAVFAAGSSYSQLTPEQINYWHKLLHYHNGKSRIVSEDFFLSPFGKENAESEMLYTVEAFKKPSGAVGWNKLHPQCVFRERMDFLMQLGHSFDPLDCKEFLDWKQGLNTDSLTLVFISAYPNYPSSLFGQTLIRLNQKNKSNDLFDYAVSFSTYGGKGLLEITKYHTRVNDYNNSESRDLIEYDLKMSEEELDKFINHLWEIYQTAYFDYQVVNSSSELADILAVAFNQDNINQHYRWYYLPSDMVKTLKQIPNRVQEERFSPSLKKQLEYRLKGLNKVELLELRDITEKEKELPLNYDQIKVLDAMIALLNYNRYRSKDNLSEEQNVLLRKALLRRAALPAGNSAQDILYDQSNSPDLGHGPQKLSFFLRREADHSVAGISYKSGYHDLMSNDYGYEPFSQFDFFSGSIIYDFKWHKLDYDQFTLIDFASLHPYKFYDPQFTWTMHVGLDRIYDLDCLLCHKFNAQAYVGQTYALAPNMAASLMAGPFTELSRHLEKGHRVGLGVSGIALFQITKAMKLGFFNELRFNAVHKIRDDFYNHASAKVTYFNNQSSEWRLESSAVSKFRSFKSPRWIHQINYGFYF